MKKIYQIIPCVAFATIASGQIAFDFESGTVSDNQKTNNFRSIRNGTYLTQTDPSDGLSDSANNDWLAGANMAPTGGSEWARSTVAVYDTTPANAADARQSFGNGTITVNFRMATTGANQAVGIYFYSANTTNLFARFTVSSDFGSGDRINFSANGSMSGGNGGETHLLPTTYSATGSTTLVNNGVQTASSAASSSDVDPTWFWVTVTYAPGTAADTSTLSLAYKGDDVNNAPSFSATVVLADTYKVIDPGLGLFIYNNVAGSVKVDDLSISTIPEPSSYGLLLAGVASGAIVFKRKRRAFKIA